MRVKSTLSGRTNNIRYEAFIFTFEVTRSKVVKIPISIFSSPLSPAEAVVSYMKEHKELSYAEIARKLNRDQRGIWCTHKRASGKNAYLMTASEHHIEAKELQNRELSILENVVRHLKEQKLSNKKIAQLLNKKASTIGAVQHRVRRKTR